MPHAPLPYPAPPRSDVVDDYHGTSVADPFRTLEDDHHPETVAFVHAQNALTRRVLDGPPREALVERLRQLHTFARVSMPSVRHGRRFQLENDGTMNQAVLVVVDEATGARRTLVDPNHANAAGTTAITAVEPDPAGRLVVYALSHDGSDVQELRVHDVDGGCDLDDRLCWVKFASIAWAVGGRAFFYTRYPEPGTVPPGDEQYHCEVRCHQIGHAQGDDRLVYSRPDAPQLVFDIDAVDEGRGLVITTRHGASDRAELHVLNLALSADASGVTWSAPRAVVTGLEHGWHVVGAHGTELVCITDAGAPMGRVVALPLDGGTGATRVIVPEGDDRLSLGCLAGGRLVVSALHHAHDVLRSYALDGSDARECPLPGIGSIVGLEGAWDRPEVLVGFTSFTSPLRILAASLADGQVRALDATPLPIDPDAYLTEQVWYPSKDGTRVSMFLVRRRGAIGPAPVLLTGYGGFNISLTPAFDPSDFLWLDAGGVMAVANLRGGGEYGERWHEAGMLERKQNVFDDCIAAAEWLVAEHVADGPVAIEGGSNGGLLVGAVMAQRPELFSAVVCRVPVADMLRYHRFTVGRFWIPEYGCAEDPDQFPFLYRYSPLHRVRDDARYPPVLVMTADTDDRVAPGMARKFAARLQEAVAHSGSGPVLLRVEMQAGHGAGKPVAKQIEEQADIYAFLAALRLR